MIGDLFSKLQDARQRIEEAKNKLNSIIIEVESDRGNIKIKANANKTLTSIEISEEAIKMDRTELEDLLMLTINKALDEAAQRGELEMKSITKDVLPNFPGLI
ncbi:MAG TPA: YbaB/EbfC family nucleoid-associated protein [Bacteroidales bacterium]|nr:YbaB/EbfC family nucleoid-associated protein [Bacteroidales bacterium]HPE58427.1 YbaB/EbfC family nucleoid-associated protein [Bacteroidales bacterium]HRX95319.1 YbaB/EbfC family nucleoid-associated protein [Bacteroidales bacterium]